MAARHNFECEQGSTFSREIVLKDAAGVVIDITGSSAAMQVRETQQATTTLLDLSSSGGEIVIVGAAGKLTITVTAGTTALLTKNGVYDIQLTYAAGTIDRILEGEFIVDLAVTR